MAPTTPADTALGHRGCPACGMPLRVPPARDPSRHDVWLPPSLRLELGPPRQGDVRSWRLSTFPDGQGRVIEQQSGGYNPRSRDQIFDLCGDGHIFLTERAPGKRDESSRWNVVAAIGGSSTGKSYLLARTLAQQLWTAGAAMGLVPGHERAMTYESSIADEIEDLPGRSLRDGYALTYENNVQMGATTFEDMLPINLLGGDKITTKLEFAGNETLVRVIQAIHVELAGGDPRSADLPDFMRWGRGMRQPIVLRTRFGHVGAWERAWTGIADLAGESFRLTGHDEEVQRRLLVSFNDLVWVVDPAINEQITELVDKAVHRRQHPDRFAHTVIAASNRTEPGESLAQAQRKRQTTQDAVADKLARTDVFRPETDDPGGPRRQLCIVVGKADLIREALEVKGLADLGEHPEAVMFGAITYLEYILRRTEEPKRNDPDRAVPIFVSPALGHALDRLRAADPAARRERVQAFTETLLDTYGAPDRFWELVDGGRERTLQAAAHRGAGALVVPSIDAHLVDSLQRGAASQMQVRDLVMSAVGCGLVFALGYDREVSRMLGYGDQEVRVFLCSPLGGLPAQEGDDRHSVFRPADGGRWPKLAKPSAGIVQLLLAILRRART